VMALERSLSMYSFHSLLHVAADAISSVSRLRLNPFTTFLNPFTTLISTLEVLCSSVVLIGAIMSIGNHFNFSLFLFTWFQLER